MDPSVFADTQSLTRRSYISPVGQFSLIGSPLGVRAILWPNEPDGRVNLHSLVIDGTEQVLDSAADQLDEYFVGKRREFEVPLDVVGTDFQRNVWMGMSAIHYGRPSTYEKLASSIGRPSAARAVGAAVALNPIAIILPCHRLVGMNGVPAGFAASHDAKRWLLDHERSLNI